MQNQCFIATDSDLSCSKSVHLHYMTMHFITINQLKREKLVRARKILVGMWEHHWDNYEGQTMVKQQVLSFSTNHYSVMKCGHVQHRHYVNLDGSVDDQETAQKELSGIGVGALKLPSKKIIQIIPSDNRSQ